MKKRIIFFLVVLLVIAQSVLSCAAIDHYTYTKYNASKHHKFGWIIVDGQEKVNTSELEPHSFGPWYVFNDTYHAHKCSKCGYIDKVKHSGSISCGTCGWSKPITPTPAPTATPTPAPHTHSYTSTVTKQPTCTEKGVTTYTCSCGNSYTEEIPETGHKWDGGKETTAATCAKAGVKTYTCQNNASHTKTESIPATGNHTWDEGKVTKQPTTTAEGVKTYTCKVCGTTKTESIPKLTATPTPTATPTAKPTAAPTATPTAGPTATPKPTAEPEEDELIIEPWMQEDEDFDGLGVSLRNDTDNEDKLNKNIYALNEKITYYVDYKNGSGRDIDNVKLVLELPLNISVTSKDGGKVSRKTITWELGTLKKDAEGTKVVTLKYTSLSKSSYKSEMIYPVADIYQNNRVMDSSSVINLIFKDEKTEIVDDEHYPYMHGDAEADTFRPDDGISRAEGALVLTRIFGMNTSGVQVTNIFPDLNQTYEEAQKAIVAATRIGLINGYTDGTYKPNDKMTRAEFMKIIASNIELMANEEGIRGLEVRNIGESIKKYKDPTRTYLVNGRSISNHWALPYVTLLARLNMTDLTARSKDVRMDEYITRAEVAQLVNFYLFRAPAEVNTRTQSGFSDVSSRHKLFADIIEATRQAHTYKLTEDGTEIAVD